MSPLSRTLALTVGLFALSLAAPAYAYDLTWDSVLERDENGEIGSHCGSRLGWRGADGGFTARHPSSNRTIWFFGDSLAAESGNNFQKNTILTTESTPPHLPNSSIGFYGRGGSGAGVVRNITSRADASWFSKPWIVSPSSTEWFWPSEAIIPSGTNTLYSFWERIKDPLTLSSHQRVYKVSNVTGTALNWPAPTFGELKDSGNNSAWSKGFWWGSHLVDRGTHIYIYGVTLTFPYDTGGAQKVVLARATPANLTNYANWEFLKVSGSFAAWLTTPPTLPSQMWTVANGAVKHFSVNRITTLNPPAWLIVQGHGCGPTCGTNEVVVRVSEDAWDGILFADYGFTSDSNTMIKNVGAVGGIDPACDGFVYHQTGQWDISNQASNQLMVSYYCHQVHHDEELGHNVAPWNCNTSDNRYLWRGTLLLPGFPTEFKTTLEGRIRFYKQNLTKLRPWCTSGLPTCDMP